MCDRISLVYLGGVGRLTFFLFHVLLLRYDILKYICSLFCVMHNYLLKLCFVCINVQSNLVFFSFRSAAVLIRPMCCVFATCAVIFLERRVTCKLGGGGCDERVH